MPQKARSKFIPKSNLSLRKPKGFSRKTGWKSDKAMFRHERKQLRKSKEKTLKSKHKQFKKSLYRKR